MTWDLILLLLFLVDLFSGVESTSPGRTHLGRPRCVPRPGLHGRQAGGPGGDLEHGVIS